MSVVSPSTSQTPATLEPRRGGSAVAGVSRAPAWSRIDALAWPDRARDPLALAQRGAIAAPDAALLATLFSFKTAFAFVRALASVCASLRLRQLRLEAAACRRRGVFTHPDAYRLLQAALLSSSYALGSILCPIVNTALGSRKALYSSANAFPSGVCGPLAKSSRLATSIFATN
jgi:hypothetical protein